MKFQVFLLLILFVSISSCKQEDEPELTAPDCDESFCVSTYRANKKWVSDYSAQLLHFQQFEGYAVAIWRNTETEPPSTFMLQVGSPQRPVFDGAGTFWFDQYQTAFFSAEIEHDSLVRFLGYAGYIVVDSITDSYFSGKLELDAQVDTLNVFLKFAGKFEVER
ncbi:MAG: hypothetical protein H0S84_13125 [Bacteroidales bacterium]|jgi:hypothetical protein|nr:hypothetical protein [Bacteroidales bacterium]MDN5351000.1 hypothetical protein [Bacteroidales bacterium]